ncbi:MAG: TonB-dependent receptor [Vicinamibacteraceae bacterium]
MLLGNTIEGHTNGFELGGTWEPSTIARVHGSYTWLGKAIGRAPGSADITGGEGNDPSHMATLQLFADLRPDVRFNVASRYISALPRPHLAAYAEADATLQWDIRRDLELSVHGQNLLHGQHPEFTSGQPNLEEYDRSVFVTVTLRLGRS